MPSNPDLLDLAANIVSARIAHNAVTPPASSAEQTGFKTPAILRESLAPVTAKLFR